MLTYYQQNSPNQYIMKKIKTILGLDLGTNSIGWALTKQEFDETDEKLLNLKQGEIIDLGVRIIPMSQDVLGKFSNGVTESQTAKRTEYRGARRLNQRHLLRRERLHRVLNVLGFLPKHYADSIDFEKKVGQFKPKTEPKLAYRLDGNDKHNFIFQESFNNMLEDFKLNNNDDLKIPYDWTIYYLRKKALTQKISKEELSWLLLNFNQKRGYYQLRGESEEDDKTKSEKFHTLLVVDVIEREKGKSGIWYNVVLENGWIYRRESKISLFNWIGTQKDFIVTTEYNDDGTIKINKDRQEKRSFRSPKIDDWGLVKIRIEQSINESGKYVGEYIYDTLLANPSQKINGQLVKTIERTLYKKELTQILKTQISFCEDLKNQKIYLKCINELYKQNETHKNNIKKRDFEYLLIEDIIYYQRSLKSKISLINDCSLEHRNFVKNGIKEIQPIKCIAKSNPIFQEFRLWQFIHNLKIYEREVIVDKKLKFDFDVTTKFIKSENDLIDLFDFLNDKKEISQKQFLANFKLKENKYRWNYVEDKAYPCNETRFQFISKITKLENFDVSFFNKENSQNLWHILYSVTDKIEIEKAINTFAIKNNLSNDFVKLFSNLKPYNKEYGSYSEKAIKKLLPLMRIGNYWNKEDINLDINSKIKTIFQRLEAIEYDEKRILEAVDDDIPKQVLKSFIKSKNLDKGLNTYQASYLVYNKHSESSDLDKWKTAAEMAWYLKQENPNRFKQHSLRNPIVEQVITETLRVVKDIWQEYGNGAENFFDEIHIELGRDMKNDSKTRERISNQISQNENTNSRIKAILSELKNDGITDIRPYSPSQQEILKIYEDGIYSNEIKKEELDIIDKIRKNTKPTKAEIQRYKLWLEQGYISPYTGETIKMSELFTTKYQIEHIFPQSRFFDDSMTNKVICESVVNAKPYKDNLTAMEFINRDSGRIVPELSTNSKTVTIFTKDQYEKHIKSYFNKNKTKQKNLLSLEIPESFVNRQMNDSRYISKTIKTLLSKIVREEKNGELEREVTSKNIVPINGAITSIMKQHWGLNDVWNDIVTPRFERLNLMTNSTSYGSLENKKNEFGDKGKIVFQSTIPDEIAKGFSKKRIDHRHHALDALVIACVSRNHTNYLNNLNAKNDDDKTIKHDLRNSICYKSKTDNKGNYNWLFFKPWSDFTVNAKNKLFETLISFKKNNRVINKTVNKYQKIEDGKKIIKTQTKGENWAIRKALHKESFYGKVFLKREKINPVSLNIALQEINNIIDSNIKNIIKREAKSLNNDFEKLQKYFKKNPIEIDGKIIDKIKIYETIEATASRNDIDTTFDEKKIKSITDLSIQKILKSHLEQSKYQNQTDDKGKPINANELAFNQEGISDMNKNIQVLNNGKKHQPIYKVRIYEEGNRFPVGQNGNKKDKYVEAAQGTNLFFAVYVDDNGKRNFETIAFNVAIERQKQKLFVAEEIDKNGNKLLFVLSPNDLVYVPTKEEQENSSLNDSKNFNKEKVNRTYKMISSSLNQCFFIRNDISTSIVNKMEFTSSNKMEKDLEGNTIKTICWKLEVNRLGKVTKIIK